MDYKKHYDQLIEKALLDSRNIADPVYYEKHHIIPKSEGGKDDPSNLVLLTAREHFLAHWLLYRAKPGLPSRAYSFWRMSHPRSASQERPSFSSRAYMEAREAFITAQKQKKITNTHFKKMRDAYNKSTKRGMLGKSHTPEAKKKIAEANMGKIRSQETREKISKARSGKIMTPEQKEKLSQAKLGKALPSLWRPVVQLASNGEKIAEFKSLKEVEKAGFNRHAVQNACSANKNLDAPKYSSGGYKWIYKD